jgi:hypothetical protein
LKEKAANFTSEREKCWTEIICRESDNEDKDDLEINKPSSSDKLAMELIAVKSVINATPNRQT